ncbi:MAG: hypothetical protein LLG00_15385 [Planctomycetaceae bacterium]|nr:hypothetical protein [Planctomycetaceae bacterium]
MRTMRVFSASIALLLCCLPARGSVFIAGASTNQLTLRNSDSVASLLLGPVSPLPVNGTWSESDTGVSASGNYSYGDGGLALSNVSFDLGATTVADMATTFRIVPTTDLTFTIDGSIHWVGSSTAKASPTLWARILDITTDEFNPTTITNLRYTSSGKTSYNATIAASAGNPITGVLLAGREYKLDLELATVSDSRSTTSGTTTGDVSILFSSEPPSVPEPAMFVVWLLLGVMGLGWNRLRR